MLDVKAAVGQEAVEVRLRAHYWDIGAASPYGLRMTKKYDDEPLFELPPAVPPAKNRRGILKRVWTDHKARLIANYLVPFVFITKHGNYVDGFAGPQYADKEEAWAAKLAIDNQPPWLRRFRLFDENPQQVRRLMQLKSDHPDRDIEVFAGDFNDRVSEILNEKHLPMKQAAFCLLDQRTFECAWSTVQRLADYKRGSNHKVELFYFLAEKWIYRAAGGAKRPQKLEQMEAWWGRSDWKDVLKMRSHARLETMCGRFRSELGYTFVDPYAIYDKQRGQGRVAYYMIHASDHDRAPDLMRTAYRHVVRAPMQLPQLVLELGLEKEKGEEEKKA